MPCTLHLKKSWPMYHLIFNASHFSCIPLIARISILPSSPYSLHFKHFKSFFFLKSFVTKRLNNYIDMGICTNLSSVITNIFKKKKKKNALPIETMFKLPSPLPTWPPGTSFFSTINIICRFHHVLGCVWVKDLVRKKKWQRKIKRSNGSKQLDRS